ncbi:MAG: hypothetical protein ICV84_18275 [Flavisolibacter sp.]|nr:hypothetical protein [Flavisolibacter sp.]
MTKQYLYRLINQFFEKHYYNIFILTVLLFSTTTKASDSLPQKLIIYKMQVENTQNRLVTGYLKNVEEEEIIYTGSKSVFGTPVRSTDKTIPLDQIGIITVKRKGAAGRTALFAGLGGLAAGALAGFIEGDDPPEQWFFWMSAGDKAAIYGTMLGVTGAVVGVIVGSVVRKKFIIQGNKEKFQQMKGTLLQKVYGSPSPKQ